MILLFSLIACRTDVTFQGTLVGNPGTGKPKLAENSSVRYTAAKATIGSIISDNDQSNNIDREIDLLSNDSLELPKGTTNSLQVYFSDCSLSIAGTTEENFILPAFILNLSSNTPFTISETETYIIELAYTGWLDEPSNLDPDMLADILSSQSALYLDNGDGILSDEERQSSLATGSCCTTDTGLVDTAIADILDTGDLCFDTADCIDTGCPCDTGSTSSSHKSSASGFLSELLDSLLAKLTW